MQYGFHNDGTVTCRFGSTGQNLHNHVGPGTGHMHNAGWRVHLDLGGSGPDVDKKLADKIEVYRVSHVETAAGKGKASTQETAIVNEGGVDWNAEQFTLLRMRNPKSLNELSHAINYDLVPLRLGSRPAISARPAISMIRWKTRTRTRNSIAPMTTSRTTISG